jgi:hypothetical protein
MGILVLLMFFHIRLRKSVIHDPQSAIHAPRIGKISMLYGRTNTLYERAIRTHEVHARQHGYPSYVLRNEIVGGYWNKPMYILSLIVQELAKPAVDRVEWFMYDLIGFDMVVWVLIYSRWFDADSVLINPHVPLDIFLPPPDFNDTHFVGNRDHNGLNTGVFFIRVHEWSLEILTKSIAFPMYRPDVDLGFHPDQSVMEAVLNETEFRSGVIYQPRNWINTYEFVNGYEGKKGDMLVHFPGMEDQRWKHMADWLDVVETQPQQWAVDLAETDYPTKVSEYWAELRRARSMLQQAKLKIDGVEMQDQYEESGKQSFGRVLAQLQFAIESEADRPGAVKTAMEELQRFVVKR